MILSLGSALLVILITASLAMRKGLYRTTILFIGCVVGAVVAFAYYENLVVLLKAEFLRQFGEGPALVLVFLLVALVVDALGERFLTGTMRFPQIVDRIGAGVLGFFTAMIAVGVLTVGIQMLPWDRSILGFERLYFDQEERSWQSRSLLLSPDGFVVSLVGYLSNNMFSGPQKFAHVHPNFLEALARSNWRVQAESRRLVPPTFPEEQGQAVLKAHQVWQLEEPSLGMVRLRPPTDKERKEEQEKAKSRGRGRGRAGDQMLVTEVTQKTKREPAEGHVYLVVRCELSDLAKDTDDWHRFTPQQLRLVGMVDGRPVQAYLEGYREPSKMDQIGTIASEQPVMFEARRNLQFDAVFEVPEGFQPLFVEYKRLARASVSLPPDRDLPVKSAEEISKTLKYMPLQPGRPSGEGAPMLQNLRDRLKGKDGKSSSPRRPPAKKRTPSRKPTPKKAAPKKAPAKKTAPAKKSKAKPQASANQPGRVRGRFVEEAAFSDKMPFALSKAALAERNASLSGNAFRAGHVYLAAENARGDPVTTFATPRDKRLFQLRCDAVHAKSFLGKAKSFAVKTVSQYAVVADNGTQYLPVGEYRIAPVGGKRMIELQYDMEGLPGRSVRPAQHIKENQLQGDSSVTFLYHIPPGTKLVKFSAGQGQLSQAPLDKTAPR